MATERLVCTQDRETGVWHRGLWGQYSHGLHGGPAGAAVALGAVGVLHRPVQLFPHGAGQTAQSGVPHGSGSVQRYTILSHGRLSSTERTIRMQDAQRGDLLMKGVGNHLQLKLLVVWLANSPF